RLGGFLLVERADFRIELAGEHIRKQRQHLHIRSAARVRMRRHHEDAIGQNVSGFRGDRPNALDHAVIKPEMIDADEGDFLDSIVDDERPRFGWIVYAGRRSAASRSVSGKWSS